MKPVHRNYFFQACVLLSLVLVGATSWGEEAEDHLDVADELTHKEESPEFVVDEPTASLKKVDQLGLGLGWGLRMERGQLVEGDVGGSADSLFQLQFLFQQGHWRFFFEQSQYSRSTSSGSLSVVQQTQLSQVGYHYRMLSQGWLSPYLGLSLGFGRDRVKTGLNGEFLEVKGSLFGLWAGELGLEALLGQRFLLEGGGRLTYPRQQDVSGQLHLKLSYLF